MNFSNKIYARNFIKEHVWKLLRFEITKILIAVLISRFIVLFIITFGTLSFPIASVVGYIKVIVRSCLSRGIDLVFGIQSINQSIKTLIHVDRPQRDKVHMVIIKIKSTMIHNNNNLKTVRVNVNVSISKCF